MGDGAQKSPDGFVPDGDSPHARRGALHALLYSRKISESRSSIVPGAGLFGIFSSIDARFDPARRVYRARTGRFKKRNMERLRRV